MKKIIFISSLLGGALLVYLPFLILPAQGDGENTTVAQKTKEANMDVKSDKNENLIAQAKVSITGTQSGSTIKGEVTLREVQGGVEVMAELSNIPNPGKHGFHVHENGSCEDLGKAAGGHFNPKGSPHGLLSKDGQGKAHCGDMGNIVIDEKGNGKFVEFLPGVSLTQGENNIVGKAIILHEKEDDFSQPTGNAGARIGCGIIELILNK